MAFDCFKKDYSKPSKPVGSHGEGDTFKARFGYIVPHTEKAQGAETPNKKTSEYQYGLSVAVTNDASILWDDRNDGGVKAAARRLVKKGCNATFEDHKNAYNNKVGGAEILVIKGDQLSKDKAELILEAFKLRFPKRNIRGVKEMRKGGRGYNNLIAAKKGGADIALLGELFFIDNDSDFIPVNTYADFLKEVLV